MQIHGAGKEADADLFHFYDEWVRALNEMEELASFRLAMQDTSTAKCRNALACDAPLSSSIILVAIAGRV
eukprot:165117-Pyramimonas_sp.AAC.1